MSARNKKARRRSRRSHENTQKQLKRLQDTVAKTVKSLILTAECLNKVEGYFFTAMEALRCSDSELTERNALVVMDDACEKLGHDFSVYLDPAIDALDPDDAEARLKNRQRWA